MIRIAALNDSSSDAESDDGGAVTVGTKEAEESEAYLLYNKALSLQRQDLHKAEDAFEQLLSHAFIREAAKLIENETVGAIHPGLQLLYSIYKNLANMAQQQGEDETAMEWYIEAVKVDETEVTVWYKIGTIALKLHNYQLARLGFEQGLQCNPNHWPCLDHVITVLYTINDYWYCLYFIARALQKDYLYPKGLAFRQQIFKEQPSLREDTKDMFADCDPSINDVKLSQEERDEYVNEALAMREKRRELAKEPPHKPYKLPLPIKSFTWRSVGESLIALYDKIKASKPPMSLALRVDMSEYAAKERQENDTTDQRPEEKMDVDIVTTKEDIQTDPVVPTTVVTESSDSVNKPENKVTESSGTGMSASESEAMQTNAPSAPTAKNISTPAVSSVTMATSAPSSSVTMTTDVSAQSHVTVAPSASSISVTMTTSMITLPATIATLEEGVTSSLSNPCTPAPTLSVANPFMDQSESGVSDTESRGKSQKRKRSLPFDVDLYGKRRSARVRNTFKSREEEKINFHELLMNFLPASLKSVSDDEDMDSVSMDTSIQSAQQVNTVPGTPQGSTVQHTDDCVMLASTEEQEVRDFLNKQQKNGGALGMMKCYVDRLARKYNVVWPKELPSVFLNIYRRLRKHYELPCLYSKDEPDDYLCDLGKACLMSSELLLDQWLSSRPKMSPGSPRGQSQASQTLKLEDLPEYLEEDLCFVSDVTAYPEVLEDEYIKYCVRAYWMKARFYTLQGDTDYALCCFNRAKYFLETAKEEQDLKEVLVYNCHVDNVVTLEIVKNQEDSLQRSQSMEETQKLYKSGQYKKVSEVLIQAFSQPRANQLSAKPGMGESERMDQLLLLQDCLGKLQEYEKAVYWGEVSFQEALQGYRSAKTSPVKEEWSKTLHQIWSNMLQMIDSDAGALIGLPASNMVRLSNNLVSVIDTMMAVPEIATDMPMGSVLPWLLLYRLIEHDERRIKLTGERKKESSEDVEKLPSSLMLLDVAHDNLGRHRWCTKSDGAVLKFYMDVLKAEMKEKKAYKDDMRQAYEQCIYCLYNHPNKKGRARHLVDHNAPQVELTWEVACDIFDYFKPKTLPEFDSVKSETVSADMESLYRRIAQLIPDTEKAIRWMEPIQSYVDGETNEVPCDAPDNLSLVSKQIYYLLADYYGKNIEHAKAIKFYMYDLCVNPIRLDSWAGMALARMCQLEQKLNATELKMEVPVHKRGIAALRCFQRAVEIEDASGKLWMEYGSLSYQLHSHASRQLKYHMEKKDELDEDVLDLDLQQIARESRQEMLQTAYNCYKNASECEDEESEEWLTQYMMGKCVEKMKRSPKEYLEHYKLAAAALHEENATYPKKIAYAYTSHTSPRLAVEALEMFYRLHVSILKLLLKHKVETDYEMYQRYIDQAAESPFARGIEKKDEAKEGFQLTTETSDTQTEKSKSTTTQQDHTYSKLKNSGGDPSNSQDSQDSAKLETPPEVSTTEMKDLQEQRKEEKGKAEAADSADEKMVDSADESRNSSDYFPSNESEEDSEDSQPDVDMDVREISEFASSQGNSAASFPSRSSPVIPVSLAKSSMLELSAELLESSQGSKSSAVVMTTSTRKEEDGKSVHDGKEIQEGLLSKQVSEGFTVSSEHGDAPVKGSNSDVKRTEVVEVSSSGKEDEEVNAKKESSSNRVEKLNFDINEAPNTQKEVIEIFSSPEPVKPDKFSFSEMANKEILKEELQTSQQTATQVVKKEEVTSTCQAGLVVIDFSGGDTPYVGGAPKEGTKVTKTIGKEGSKEQEPEPMETEEVKEEVKENNSSGEERMAVDVSKQQQLKDSPAKLNTSVSDDSVIILDSDVEEAKESGDQVLQSTDKGKSDIHVTGGKAAESKMETEDKQRDEEPILTVKSDSLEIKEVKVEKSEGNSRESEMTDGYQESKAVESKEASQNEIKKEAVNISNGQGSETMPKEGNGKGDESRTADKDTRKEKALSGDALRRQLIEKCMAALHLCLSRFPTHYKSLYRLAYVYFYSPYHKNPQYAKDLLFGTQNWSTLSYMPAPGLFSERKLNNFFQGTWKLPIDEVERSGSFATHLNKAVLLLLKILCEQKDVHSLYHVHLQLSKTPEAGKKYLRDGERTHYAKLAYHYCLEAVKSRIPEVRQMADRDKAVRSLMETYRIWNYGISKHKHLTQRVNNLLAATFKAVLKDEVSLDKPVMEQAVKFCQHQQQLITLSRQQKQAARKPQQDRDSGNQSSDSSMMSPDRSLSQSYLFSPQRTSGSQMPTPSRLPSSPMKLSSSLPIEAEKKFEKVCTSDNQTSSNLTAVSREGKESKASEPTHTSPSAPFLQIKTPPTPSLNISLPRTESSVTSNTEAQQNKGIKASQAQQKDATIETGKSAGQGQKTTEVKVTLQDDDVIEILSSDDEDGVFRCSATVEVIPGPCLNTSVTEEDKSAEITDKSAKPSATNSAAPAEKSEVFPDQQTKSEGGPGDILMMLDPQTGLLTHQTEEQNFNEPYLDPSTGQFVDNS